MSNSNEFNSCTINAYALSSKTTAAIESDHTGTTSQLNAWCSILETNEELYHCNLCYLSEITSISNQLDSLVHDISKTTTPSSPSSQLQLTTFTTGLNHIRNNIKRRRLSFDTIGGGSVSGGSGSNNSMSRYIKHVLNRDDMIHHILYEREKLTSIQTQLNEEKLQNQLLGTELKALRKMVREIDNQLQSVCGSGGGGGVVRSNTIDSSTSTNDDYNDAKIYGSGGGSEFNDENNINIANTTTTATKGDNNKNTTTNTSMLPNILSSLSLASIGINSVSSYLNNNKK